MRIYRLLTVGFFASAMAVVPQLQPPAREKENAKAMFGEIEKANRQLEEFEKTKEVTHLENAIKTVEGIDVSQFADVRRKDRLRHQTGTLWLSIVSVIDRTLDPKFDANDLPEESITPPPSGAVEYPSATDPKAIQDPVARSEYEKALRENRRKAEKYRLQTKLRRLDVQATLDVDRFLTRHYTDSALDQADFETLLTNVKLSSTRQQHLRSLFKKRSD